MKNKALKLFGLLMLASVALHAEVRLPKVISNGMVLQRDKKVKVWGWAAPGERVTVSFKNKSFKTTASGGGDWQVLLPAMKAGGPYTMTIQGSNRIELDDILIGDVWICSGQSNMVHQMELHNVRYAKDVAEANNNAIRHFWVANVANMQDVQQDVPGGSWKKADPENIGEFSAVAYFFAEALYQKYHVPIGLINSSWGGSPIEAWMSNESLKDFPELAKIAEKNRDTAYINKMQRMGGVNRASAVAEDKGMKEKWFDPAYQPKEWRRIAIPGYWEDQGIRNLDGVVWYRREIDVPQAMPNSPAKVFMGRIVDADVMYINGKQIGNTGYMYPQRRYTIPAGVLKAGKNLFVIRVTNNAGKGGFVPDKPYQLIAGADTIDLTGYWQYKVGLVNVPKRGAWQGGGIAAQNLPTALYNSMIYPLLNYGIKGFLWYQGESNTGNPNLYAKLQPAMIKDWRAKWQTPDAPFLYVQLPGFMEMNYLPSESQWAAFREAQASSLDMPNTGMAVAIDLGEWNDIHPERKKEVGQRLALIAEKIAYHEKDIVATGPVFQSATVDGNNITVSFSSVGNGLTTQDGEEPEEFAIAGADKVFVWAKAKIEGNKIILSSDEVPHPMYVRYAWADDPVNPNLINKEGLPAAPFRTDKP
ncbi:sialate O-acetylesterase [Mucilaginibacter sp. KACC 22063]|uniref:sialate O-acetylesterase n=1 Tax=Mucilaginibacter sp. KACC 22063 TaxID=3025666 RepID=UPI002366B027|nr:sialate O-acetylesterase [Mucilaginibacter sp. KACC 22063]WDF56158.1 sialate O-acetylesterase [Mucilaginibacter sp. KACC 22063]